MTKTLNENFNKMDQLIKKQLELFNNNGDLTKENKEKFDEMEKQLDDLNEILEIQFNNLKAARHKENGKIYKAFNCKYSIAAIEVEGQKMSWTKFFNDYIAI